MITFVIQDNQGSAQMRAVQMVQYLNEKEIEAQVKDSVEGLENQTIVFVKRFDPVDVVRAKEKNTIIYDTVDFFSKERSPYMMMGFPLFDGVIYPNKVTQDYFGGLFQGKTTIIHHHWTREVQEECPRYSHYPYEFRLGYLGAEFNHKLKELIDVFPVYHPARYLEYSPFFTCHYNVREPNTPDFLFKPATKCSNAAAVNANIITTKDPSTVELLGENYPYYVEDYSAKGVFEVIKKASETFEQEEWFDGLKMMKEVREKTSPEAITDQYIEFFQEFK